MGGPAEIDDFRSPKESGGRWERGGEERGDGRQGLAEYSVDSEEPNTEDLWDRRRAAWRLVGEAFRNREP